MEFLLGLGVPLLIFLTDKAFGGHITDAVDAWQKSFHSVQRLKARHVAKPGSTKSLFEISWAIYELLPEELRDSRKNVIDWLREDDKTTDTEEIWLVARSRRLRPRSICGVLYATLYEYTGRGSEENRCFVSGLVVHREIQKKQAAKIRKALWEGLNREIEKTTDREECHFVFETIGQDKPPRIDEAESDRRREYREFIKSLGGHRVEFDDDAPYLIPDPDDPKHPFEGHLYYLPRGTPRHLSRAEIAEFVYGTVKFWAFNYGQDLLRLGQIRNRADYLWQLAIHVAPELAGPNDLVRVPDLREETRQAPRAGRGPTPTPRC